MVLERELIKQERFYAREITRIFDRAVSALDPTRRVNLTRATARPAVKTKIQTATLNIFKQGIVSVEDEIKQALKRASAATIDTTLNDFESGIAKIYANDTTEYMGFLSKEMQDQMNVSLAEGHALGESIPKLSDRLKDTWKLGKVRAVRYARTQTNDVYNAAHMSRYSSSSVVEYVQFSAHLDDRTSPICRMYHKTIWKKNDPGIQVPPLHFNCRSRLLPYFGKVPGERDFKILSDGTEITGKEVKAVDKMLNTFKTKYWKSSGDAALKKAILMQHPKIRTDAKLIEDTSGKEFYHITNNKSAKLTADYEQEVQEFGKGLYITDTANLKFWNRQMQGRDYAIKVDISDINIIREEMMPSISKMSKDLKALGYSGSDIAKFKPTVGTLRTNPMDIAIKRTWAKEAGFQGIIPKIRTADSVEQCVLFNLDGVEFNKPVDTLNLIKRLDL